jgi:hypothetical protein
MIKKETQLWRYYGLVVAAWLVYILLTILAPASQNTQVQLSEVARLVLTATLLIPYMLTWLIAVVGWYHFNRFASDTERKHARNYAGFRMISRGLGILIFDLISIPLINVARRVWVADENVAAALTILSNYLHIIIPLVAFGCLFLGSRKLVQGSHYAVAVRSTILPSLVATLLFTVLFTIAVFGNTSRQVATEAGRFATYYLPDPLIVLTIIIPLAVTWFVGLHAVLQIERYVHSLSQVKWRRAIVNLFHGLLAVIGSSIILQAITAFGSEQLQHVSLVLIIVIIYLFIILQAVGYLFIRASAKQLRHLLRTGVPNETD